MILNGRIGLAKLWQKSFWSYKYKKYFSQFPILQLRTTLSAVLLNLSKNIDDYSTFQEIIMKHVQSVYLGRRNFHYLMSGLVLDDHWDTEVAEYGAINMTGLRIVRPGKQECENIDLNQGWPTLLQNVPKFGSTTLGGSTILTKITWGAWFEIFFVK